MTDSVRRVAIVCPSCEAKFRVAPELIGRRGKCPKCTAVFRLDVPLEDEEPKPADLPSASDDVLPFALQPAGEDEYADVPVGKEASCPSCEGELEPGAVICIQCGYDVRTGQRWNADASGHVVAAQDAGEARTTLGALGVMAWASLVAAIVGGLGLLLGHLTMRPALWNLQVASLLALLLGIIARVMLRKDDRARPADFAVVVSVITLLMGILLPALASAREHAKRAVCAANLKRVGEACSRYVNAHGAFPPDLTTLVSTGFCAEGVLSCPSAPDQRDERNGTYIYIAGQTPSSNNAFVLVCDKPENHTGRTQDEESKRCGGHVLYQDGRVEFVSPYARVRELVAETIRILEDARRRGSP